MDFVKTLKIKSEKDTKECTEKSKKLFEDLGIPEKEIENMAQRLFSIPSSR